MPETRCTVQDRTWKDELPSLPDDVSALLAPPVVVRFDTVADHASRAPGRANPRAAARVG